MRADEEIEPGARFSKVPIIFRARKAIRKMTTCLLCKGNKNKNNCKVSCPRRLRFEDAKIIMSPEIRPKSFGNFEKQAPGPVVGRRVLSPLRQTSSGGHNSFPRTRRLQICHIHICFSHLDCPFRSNRRQACRT